MHAGCVIKNRILKKLNASRTENMTNKWKQIISPATSKSNIARFSY